MPSLFYKAWHSLADCFRGWNLAWQAVAVAVTYLCVVSGLDWAYFLALRNVEIYKFLLPAAIVGSVFPVLVPLTMLAIGKARQNVRTVNAAWGTGQGALLGLFFSSVYKVFTGRIQPPQGLGAALTNLSSGFRFGFYRGGTFWGWPSSHTMTSLTAVIALIMLYPEKKWVKVVAIIYAGYVAVGVSASIHWLSDVIAGVVFSIMLGIAVGRQFQKRHAAVTALPAAH